MEQKGFTLVEGLLLVIAVSIIGFGGFYAYDRTKGDQPESVSSMQEVDPELRDVMPNEDDYQEESFANIDFGTLSLSASFPTGWDRTRYEERGEPCKGDYPGEWKEIELTSEINDIVTIFENGDLKGCGGGFAADIFANFNYSESKLIFDGRNLSLSCEVNEPAPFCPGDPDSIFVAVRSTDNAPAPNGNLYVISIETGSRDDDEITQVEELLAILETVEFKK